jgi:hypothetical protein
MWLCAALCVVGGVLALWVRNDVLSPAAPPECFHCGVTDPPTQIGQARQPAGSTGG